MTLKRIISFMCVLILALTVASGFTYAALPETDDTIETNVYADVYGEVVKTSTYLFNSASSSSGYVRPDPIPVGTRLYIYSTSSSGWYYRVRVTYNGETDTGYVLTSKIDVEA